MKIPFSPPDITEREIQAVVEVLRSGWITTGPKTALFEEKIASYCQTEKAICLNSATAGLELVLRLFEIGEGDEVITTPYTFAATANVILHCGAKPIFADINQNDFNISLSEIEKKINPKTKAIIPVDFAGLPCDYDGILTLVKEKQSLFVPKKNTLQENLGRILVLADAAHSFGSLYKKRKSGSLADFTVFSFHAVKNLTTAEGGAITFSSFGDVSADSLYKKLKLLSLHGQSKTAIEKIKPGNWHYTIDLAGYKYNMTDIAAAIGLVQLERFDPEITPKRKKVADFYSQNISEKDFILPILNDQTRQTNYHLYPLRVRIAEKRDSLIQKLAEAEIAANVHFIPLPMHPLYKNLGYRIEDYPNTLFCFEREISLPIHSFLEEEKLAYIVEKLQT